ncbi:CinA family protein [Legionella tunisiensis]|uniref:CinA family protein n=1 Tax=Legionella tunisiensis TaxID=1034944 RepID=UPI0002F5C3F5|nr:CinA family protein [Legionella tunisiensis]
MDELNSLVINLTDKLHAGNLKIATAESCTGGLIAGLLTELPGSSVWFERGFVTYSNQAKQDMLGVKASLIQLNGAVSLPVAEAMACGALSHSCADIALSVTGIAGPDGGSLEKPVGTVCFAWAMVNLPVQSMCCHFQNASRQKVRHLACQHALQGVISLLNQIAQ